MNAFGFSIPLVSALAVVVAVALVLSVITLFNYFFGGPNPLSSNAQARVDAGQKPEILLSEFRRYQRRRVVGALVVLTAIFAGLVFLAPEAAMAIAEGLWHAGEEIAAAIQKSATIMAAQVGSP